MKKRNNMLSTVFPPCLQFVGLLSLLAALVSVVAGRIYVVTQFELGKLIFWNVEYFFVLALFMELFGVMKLMKGRTLLLTAGLYTVSFLLVWLSGNYVTLNFWMLGVLLLGYVIPPYMAVAFHIILTISYCMVNSLSVEEFICYFTFGTLILLLAKFIDKLINMGIILVIAVTTNLAFLILLNDFELNLTSDVIHNLVSTGAIILFLWVCDFCFDPLHKKDIVVQKELMAKLLEYSEHLHEHSVFIGRMSEGAARKINAREDIAFAGGCYHEIGRIEENDYITAGVGILQKAKVSKRVIQVVKEHNIHRDKPTSREAAIVMLSDSIVSTIQYLKQRQPDAMINMDDVVQSIFNKRFENGILDKSGLSMEDIVLLKEYYSKSLTMKRVWREKEAENEK